MENMNKHMHASPCPICGKPPERTHSTAQHDMHPEFQGSLYYNVFCKGHPEIFGQGKTAIVAVYNYEREVRRYKDEQTRPRIAHWLGGKIENRKLEDL